MAGQSIIGIMEASGHGWCRSTGDHRESLGSSRRIGWAQLSEVPKQAVQDDQLGSPWPWMSYGWRIIITG